LVTNVGASPLESSGNPYISLLYDALRAQGVSVQAADLRPWRLYAKDQRYDVLHIHWPEYIMVGSGAGSRHRARVRAAALAVRNSTRVLRSRGVRLVWTAHNIRPHNPDTPAAQIDLYGWLAREADAVIVHTNRAGQLVRDRLGRTGPMYLARHGNYIGVYDKASMDRKALRQRYGVSESDRVLLAFGQIRAYKRLVELANDFRTLAPSSARLIIAGAPMDSAVTAELRRIAAASERVMLFDRHIPESEVAALYALSDLAVFNYAEIFSSGSLLLALSLGVAVLAPEMGMADDLVGRPAMFAWAHSPLEVLDEALECPPDLRRSAALEVARAHDWASSARVHVDAYDGGLPNLP
jgi:glycosyltransferase involved in cell wall biosynthesis